MARMARAVVPGIPYHVTHRGNRREDVFFCDDDRRCYQEELLKAAERWGLDIWAYCWMSNHVHMIVVPHKKDSLSRAIGRAHGEYSRWMNKRKGWTGHLWANRFYSCSLEGSYLWMAARYVELNAVRAGLAATAEQWPWSSARAHALREPNALLSETRPFPGDVPDWSAWLRQGLRESEIQRLRLHTRTGRPLGSDSFITRQEAYLGRSLRAQKVGRKRKIGDS